MSTTVLFVGVVVFAFVAGRVLERFTAKAFALAGVEYLLLGVILGPGLGVLDREVMQALDLFVSTVLGVLGFLVGLEIRQIRATMESLLAGSGATAAVVLGVAAAMTGLYQWLDPALLDRDPLIAEPLTATDHSLVSLWITPEALWIGLTVGAAAGTCSVVMVGTMLQRFDVSPERTTLLHTMTSMAQVFSAFAFGLAMAGSRATTTAVAMGLTIVEWATITILSGGFTGLLFSVFLGREDDRMRLSVAAVGVIVFAAGVGAALGVSPLFANLFAGLTLALTSPHAGRLEDALRPLRFPTTVLVLLLAGATWTPVSGAYWLLLPAYVLLRTVARLAFSRLAVSTFMGDDEAARGIGRGLLGQGVLASAISLAFAQRFPELAAPVTSTILGGVLLTDLFAQRSLRRYLADAGEIKVLTPAAAPQGVEADGEAAAVPERVEEADGEAAAVPERVEEADGAPVPSPEGLTVPLEAAVPVPIPEAPTVRLEGATAVPPPDAVTVRLEATTPVPLPGTRTVRPRTATPVALPDAVTVPLHVTDAPAPAVPPEAAAPVALPDALTVPLDVADEPVPAPAPPAVPPEGASAPEVPPEPGSPAGPATKERA